MSPGWLHGFAPELSAGAQAFIRSAYGVLLLGTLLITLPNRRRFFVSERWGGYSISTPQTDRVQNPTACLILMASWATSAILLILGVWSVGAALGNLILCRYFFIQMRWKGVLRGMGAPGFLTYWLAGAVFLLELTRRHASDLAPLALLVLQVDFACIILSAGVYKLSAGYAQNEGMEFGLVNPQWGYWWRWWRRLPPDHWLFRTLNHLAWGTEVGAALCMLFPPTRFLGGLLLICSFAFIASQIRLGFLCEMVMLCGVLYFPAGGLADRWLGMLVAALGSPPAPSPAGPSVVAMALGVGLVGYLTLLPLAHGGLFYNFYARRSLPRPIQQWLEAYTNFFGMIIWRVFSVDVVNFFILIFHQRREETGARTLISRYGWREGGLRFSHVGEAITITSLFTTLKYYAGNPALFVERLLRYARSVPHPADSILVFEYRSIRKIEARFVDVPVAEYRVDAAAGTVDERILDSRLSVRAAHPVSPVHEGARPGSYAPLLG